MNSKIIDQYLESLSNGQKLIGFWFQGSKAIGYGDNSSDEDYVIVWSEQYPTLASRKEGLETLGTEIIDISDRETKGIEYVRYNDEPVNFVHMTDRNLFEMYPNLIKNNIPEVDLYILGGLSSGIIKLDKTGELENYKNSLIVTDEILKSYIESRRKVINRNLSMLKTAGNRKHVIDYVKSLNFLLTTYNSLQYLENKKFPIGLKWISQDAKTFDWSNSFLDSIAELEDEISYEKITDKLEQFGKIHGFKAEEFQT